MKPHGCDSSGAAVVFSIPVGRDLSPAIILKLIEDERKVDAA